MLDVAIIIEGQDGINWARWRRLVRAVEDFGFAGLYRSEHFTNPTGPNRDALELWSSLTWLADHTSRIEFGPLVSCLFSPPGNHRLDGSRRRRARRRSAPARPRRRLAGTRT